MLLCSSVLSLFFCTISVTLPDRHKVDASGAIVANSSALGQIAADGTVYATMKHYCGIRYTMIRDTLSNSAKHKGSRVSDDETFSTLYFLV